MTEIPRTAVILAAGRGRRLGPYTETKPKCLLEAGATLLERQLRCLRRHGISHIAVVAGYRAASIRRRLCGDEDLILNADYAGTNTLYSLWLAREHAGEGFLLLNADVLFDEALLSRLLNSPYGDAFTVNRRDEFEEEEMKVELRGERIVAISKTLPPARAHAENVGVLKVSRAGAALLFGEIERLLKVPGMEKQYCAAAFDRLAPFYPFYAVPVDDLPWIEIDFPEDLARARRSVWPAIQARRRDVPCSGAAGVTGA